MAGSQLERVSRRPIGRSYVSNLDTASKHNASIVLEFGSSFIQVGVAGDSKPRHIIPCSSHDHSIIFSEYLSAGPFLPVKSGRCRTASEWEQCLFTFFSNLYTNTLLLKPRSRRLILLMPSSFYYPHTFKEALQTTLLDRLKVPSLLFVEGGSLQTIIPYALGKQVGILIDIGRLEARVIGVFNSLLQDTLQIVPVGFESLLRRVIEIVDDVNTLDDARTLVQSSLLGNFDSNDTNENDSSINLNIKHLVDEMFFDLSNPNSLVLAFFQSLSKCPVDLRKEMIRNVSIVGGGILGIPGFEKRFLVSIRNLFEKIEPDDGKGYFRLCDPSHRKFQPLAVVVMQSPLKINYPLPFSPSSIGWIGGSIMGSLNIPEDNWVNRDRFG